MLMVKFLTVILSVVGLSITFYCYAKCCYAEYHIFTLLLIVMLMNKFLTVVLSVVILSIVFYCNAKCCYAEYYMFSVLQSVVMLVTGFAIFQSKFFFFKVGQIMTRHSDNQHNDTWHSDTQHNFSHRKDTECLVLLC
jgi:hypothetical protein